MALTLDDIQKLNLPKAVPLTIPPSVLEVASRLGLTLKLTSPSVPEQYELASDDGPAGYIRVRHSGMSVSYPSAGGERLYECPVDGFGGFTDHEREAKLLFALGLIAARLLRV
jgi:hypothetical protein